eukprot:TRINITY_DN675_c0_g1_i2.p1 TRINITY_DN675_c0_g1~~TRINITY_DN675_c0_g1_i2.p1  ORF type:complete len:661 (-),score=177.79 TRINITY_DN675_c0_g1_i2:148-2130(-)
MDAHCALLRLSSSAASFVRTASHPSSVFNSCLPSILLSSKGGIHGVHKESLSSRNFGDLEHKKRVAALMLRESMAHRASFQPVAVNAVSTTNVNGTTSTTETVPAVAIKPGDTLPMEEYISNDPYSKLPQRRFGILLHPTSLPGPYGIGELGEEAFKFLDWLSSTGATAWQVLPLVPPGRKSGEDGSPYSGQDANCGNTLLISLDELVKDGLLSEADLPEPVPVGRVNYDEVAARKDPLIAKAARNLVESSSPLKEEMEKFLNEPVIKAWLPEAALFSAIDTHVCGDMEFWWLWPEDLRNRHPAALEKVKQEHKDYIEVFIAQQFLFQRQWQALHSYATEHNICIIGDMPIYVGGHSADVWANRCQFMLDAESGVPAFVSGVPPDLFSATGQRWGSPLYNWQAMASDGYTWWASRMRRAFDLYDEFRIDHFRGLAAYWSIDASGPTDRWEETAMNGEWQLGPRVEFFDAMKAAVGKIDIIAEDLGVITTDVVELRQAIGAPGMAVLQFAFGGNSTNPHLPHNHEQNQVVYPGTHDNETVVGWWEKLSDEEKEKVLKYVPATGDGIHWDFIRVALQSVARMAVVAMQDILGLDNSSRMNTPAVKSGNWGWRVGESTVFESYDAEAAKLRGFLSDFNRLPPPPPPPPSPSATLAEEVDAYSK